MANTVAIFAGGTGGHIFPALAVAELLQKKGYQIVWFGVNNGPEQSRAHQCNFTFVGLPKTPMNGKSLYQKITTLRQVWTAMRQARRVLMREKPTFAIGFGGYVSFAAGLACIGCCPLYLQEQNRIMGLANRLLQPLAKRVFLNMPLQNKQVSKSVVTGNPLRETLCLEAFAAKNRQREPELIRLSILGGSLGAQTFNTLFPKAFLLLPAELRKKIRVFHQYGPGKEKPNYPEAMHAVCEPYVDNMAALYQNTDIAVARAGALTLSELALFGIPALLIPYPYAADAHQQANAEYYAQQGACLVLDEKKLDPQILAKALQTLLQEEKTVTITASISALATPEATKAIVENCLREEYA